MAEAKKPTKPRAPSVVDQAAAAELLGITEAELVRSRMRGLPPGTLGFRKDGGSPLEPEGSESFEGRGGRRRMTIEIIILVVVLILLVLAVIRR